MNELQEKIENKLQELEQKPESMVFYNNEAYSFEGVFVKNNNGELDKVVALRPLQKIVVQGEDILNIKNCATGIKKCSMNDGTYHIELSHIPDDGQLKDDNGFVILDNEVNNE